MSTVFAGRSIDRKQTNIPGKHIGEDVLATGRLACCRQAT
jgi:hypothetical protein